MSRSRVLPAFGLMAFFAAVTPIEAALDPADDLKRKQQEYERSIREQARRAQDPARNIRQEANPSASGNAGTTTIDQGYVADAIIESTIPFYLRPGERLAVNVEIAPAKPFSPARLAERMRILIDGKEIDPAPIPEAAQASASPGQNYPSSGSTTQPGSGAVVASRPSDGTNKVKITLFGRVPMDLPYGMTFAVSVYSGLDGRIIATNKAESAPLPAASKSPEKTPAEAFWDTYGWLFVIGAVLAIAAFGHVVRTREKRAAEAQIKSLEETVQSTRTVLGAVSGEAPKHAGSSGAEVPQVNKIEVPEVILEALDRGELGIVMGAAASVYANLPAGASLWLSIIDRLRAGLSDAQRSQLQKLIAESGSDAAIEPLLSLVGRDQVLEALDAELSMDRASPKDFHRHLAALAPLGARRFVDLGWDGVLESVLEGSQVRTFSTIGFIGLSEALRATRVTLIKPFGEIDHFEDLSLTAQEFRRQLADSPELERCLASLFSAQTLLFVGMSTKAIEQFLSGLPPQLEFSGREHFALVPFDWTLELWSQGFAKRYGITVLPVGTDASEESVTATLGRILKAALARRASMSPAAGNSGDLTGIGALRSVKLQNIGNFTSIEIDFHEHWNLLLGDNGGGKSTILRAITLALSGNDTRGEAMAARLLRNGESSGSIELSFGTGTTKIRTGLVRDGTRVKITAPQITPLQAGQGLVLGFPALRGVTTTQQTGVKPLPAPDPNVDDVAPLLQERVDTRLNQLKQWVINTAIQTEKAPQGREAQMFKTFGRVLHDVVPGRHVKFEKVDSTWTVLLSTDDGIMSFDSLSQGTSSILGWIGVLLQRLYDIYPNATKPEDGPALLLIDEIDAHLHPRWQRKLVKLTREQFPNVQMIASSHSPLLAGSMRREELRIVERDPASGQMRASMPLEDLHGQTADQILTSSLFAMSTTRSPEAEAKIKRYFELYEKDKREPRDEQELRELEGELDQLNYGPTRQMRETQQALQQQIKTQLDAITPEMAAAISARMAAGNRKTEETA